MKKLVRLLRKDGQALYLDPEVVTKVDSTADPALALELAGRYGGIDGDHHKAWTIDQMVRALTGCTFERVDERPRNRQLSEEYLAWVKRMCAGTDGPNTYDWDVGTPP